MSHSFNRRSLVAGIAGVGALGAVQPMFAQDGTPAADDIRVVPAANGDIEVSGTPERIAVMEYELVEHLQTVGLTPAGASERDSVNNWVNLPVQMGEEVVDLGTRDEPDMEAIIVLEPDLILAAHPRQDAVIEQLEAIATTVQLETYSPRFTPTGDETSLDHAKTVLRGVALATNTVEIAEQKIAEFDTFMSACAGRISQIGYEGQPYVYGSLQLSADGTINLFTDLSRVAGTISALGLTNAIVLEDNPGGHFYQISLEQVGTLPEDILFFYSVNEAVLDTINETLESEAWKSSSFVQNGGVISLGTPNIWTAGGLITMTNMVTRVMMELEMRGH